MKRNTTALPVKADRTPARRGISLQERIYRVLDQRLLAGDCAPGSALPTEDALATEFGVSRVTIRAALARLEQDGRIRRIQGRGTVVTQAPRTPVRVSLTDMLSDMDQVARATSLSLLAFSYRPAPPDVCAMLRLSAEEICQHAVRLRSAEGRVMLHITTFIPAAIGRLWSEADMAHTPLRSLMTRHGITPAAGEQVVTAALAGPDVAARLNMELGAALLRVQRTYVDAANHPIEYVEILGPATSFELRMELRSAAA